MVGQCLRPRLRTAERPYTQREAQPPCHPGLLTSGVQGRMHPKNLPSRRTPSSLLQKTSSGEVLQASHVVAVPVRKLIDRVHGELGRP